MYEAVKQINKLTPQSPLLIQGKNGTLTINPQEKVEIIAKYFKDVFYKNAEPMPEIEPIPMKNPLTPNEIQKAVQKMKSNKSPGCDQISVELIKYAPPVVFTIIADLSERNHAWTSTTPTKTRKSKRPTSKPKTNNTTLTPPQNTCLLYHVQNKE